MKESTERNKELGRNIGFVIKLKMKEVGMKHYELADKLGWNNNILSLKLNGHRSLKLVELKEICLILDIPFLAKEKQ